MNRLGLTHPSTLTGKYHTETRALYQALSNHADTQFSTYLTTKLPTTEALIGPFGVQLHTPRIGRAFLEFCNALRELPGLEMRTRQIALLVVAVQEQAQYELYTQERMALAQGLTEAELYSVLLGVCPDSFNAGDRAAYKMARELCDTPGALSDESWNNAVIELGRPAALALVQHVGFQRYITTILRGFNAQTPAEGERIEIRGGRAPTFT